MRKDWIPRTDAELLSYSAHFASLLSENPTSFGATLAMSTELTSLQEAYATALEAATNPQTRGPANVLIKENSRRALVQYLRIVGRQIQGTATVTDVQRQNIGLPIRDVEPTPEPIPGFAPDIDRVSINGRTVRVRLHNSQTLGRRGKPPAVAGAAIFSYRGETPPEDGNLWRYEGSTTRTVVDVTFPSSGTAERVYITAYWVNRKQQAGPAAVPVSADLAATSAAPVGLSKAA